MNFGFLAGMGDGGYGGRGGDGGRGQGPHPPQTTPYSSIFFFFLLKLFFKLISLSKDSSRHALTLS